MTSIAKFSLKKAVCLAITYCNASIVVKILYSLTPGDVNGWCGCRARLSEAEAWQVRKQSEVDLTSLRQCLAQAENNLTEAQ